MTDRVHELVVIIANANRAYYDGQGSGLTDHAYDKLVEELRTLSPNHPLLRGVGHPAESLKKVKHTIHMGSQFKALNADEFMGWYAAILPHDTIVVGSLKMDGFSMALYYEKGLLMRAVTRGDGIEGEDITANALKFIGVPAQLPTEFTGAVRGEGVLCDEHWKAVDPDQESNPRNLAAGISHRKDGTQSEFVTFYAFDMDYECTTEAGKMLAISAMGFRTPRYRVCGSRSEAEAFFGEILVIRQGLPYWIDGVIFKVNSLAAQKQLGYVDNRPKAQIAWKFEAEEAETTLNGIQLSVGHTGKIIPTAILEPVEIGGVTVKSALLCNWEEIVRLGVGIGDRVTVIRAGDVIPKIIAKVSGNGAIVDLPLCCPVCKGSVGKLLNTDGSQTADLYCLNEFCSAKATGKIKRWIKSLDIQGIGDEVLEALTTVPHVQQGVLRVQGPMVHTVVDLYKLDVSQLATLSVNGKKLGTKRSVSIFNEINNKSRLTIDQFLGSLGLKNLGKRRVELIRAAATSLECMNGINPLNFIECWWTTQGSSFLRANAAQLGIPGIADEIQADLDTNKVLMQDLLKCITIVEPDAPAAPVTGPLSGQVFAFTGCRANDVTNIAIATSGGKVSEDLNKTCTYLVQADPTKESSKTKKAKAWGLKVISMAQLVELLAKG